MTAPEDFNKLYSDVSASIGSAMEEIRLLNVENKDGKREIGNISDKLREIQARFESELNQLRSHAEWDIFTLGFFGETNAGKSTIIESLRIIFKEESRQALLLQNSNDVEKFAHELSIHIELVRKGLLALHNEYTDELTSISQSTSRLTRIVEQEVQARLEITQQEAAHRKQLAEQESSARLAAEQQEISQRLQIAKAHALSRFKVRMVLFGIAGILVGAASTATLLKLVGV